MGVRGGAHRVQADAAHGGAQVSGRAGGAEQRHRVGKLQQPCGQYRVRADDARDFFGRGSLIGEHVTDARDNGGKSRNVHGAQRKLRGQCLDELKGVPTRVGGYIYFELGHERASRVCVLLGTERLLKFFDLVT